MQNWVYGKGKQENCVTKVTQQVADAFAFPEHENRKVWIKYLPHAQSILRFQRVIVDNEEAERGLLFKVGESFRSRGKYDKAEAMYRQALELREKVLDGDHSDILDSMNNLGSLLGNQGKYDEAERMQRERQERITRRI